MFLCLDEEKKPAGPVLHLLARFLGCAKIDGMGKYAYNLLHAAKEKKNHQIWKSA